MERNIRILLVEDEEHLQEMIRMNLELEGYEVVAASDGVEGLQKARTERFDLVVLDVMLPRMDGFTVCKTMRVEGMEVPVLFLTARQSGQDRIEGLKIGGDDYLTKPFNLEELLLRVQKLLIRSRKITQTEVSDEFRIGPCKVNFKTHEATDREGSTHLLAKKEVQLLRLLIQQPGEVISREEILETVWGYDVFPSTRTVDNYVMNLRKIFEENPRQPNHIHSVRGIGYRFTP